MMNLLNKDRVKGAMLGVAIGEVVGEVIGATQLTLLVARGIWMNYKSPIEGIGSSLFNWLEDNPKAVGLTCEAIIREVHKKETYTKEEWFVTSEKYHLKSNGETAGNGALMRMVYPAICYPIDEAVSHAVDLGKITHWHEHSTLAITCYTKAVAELVRTEEEKDIAWRKERLEYHMREVRELGEQLGKGENPVPTEHVIDSLLCALNSIRDTESFEEAVVKAVNLGGTTDAIGALTGSLVGAIYGEEVIPKRWSETIDKEIRFDLTSHYVSEIVYRDEWDSIKKKRKEIKLQDRKISKSRAIVERRFKLYLVLIACEVASYAEIFGKVRYTSIKMLRRDIESLNRANLVKLKFDSELNGYVHADGWGRLIELDEDLREIYSKPIHSRLDNPDKQTAQLYRLVDLLFADLEEECWIYPMDFAYSFVDNEGDEIRTNDIYLPTESAFERQYKEICPNTTKEDMLDDLATLERLGVVYNLDVRVYPMRDECEFIIKYERPLELFWDTGEEIDTNSDWEMEFYEVVFDVWGGFPCKLPMDTIPEDEWPEIK